MKAKTIKGNSPDEIKIALEQSLTDGISLRKARPQCNMQGIE
jgi:hypothetical protein